MTRLPESIQERLIAHLVVLDYSDAIALADEAYPVSRGDIPVPERAEMFGLITCHVMDNAGPESVMAFIAVYGHELSAETLGDIAADPEWSELLQPTRLAD